jgi:hypothetical protein
MLRFEFEEIRDLPGKRIEGDLVFASKKGSRPSYVVEDVPVANSLGIDLIFSGLYNPVTKKLTLNFHIKGVGPICRVCINGRLHEKVGRTHKHDLIGQQDPDNNIPNVVIRKDLLGKTISQVWSTLCSQSQITHNGGFIIPGGTDVTL